MDDILGIGKTIQVVSESPLYGDAIQPAAKQIGKSLETIGKTINMVLAPLAGTIFAYEKISEQLKSKLASKLEKTNPENLVTPPLNIFGPIVEKYRFSFNVNELADMFENLLANSMDKNTASLVHPSFVNIISELTPDEAKLIKFLSNQKTLPKIDVNYQLPSMKDGHLTQFINFTNFGEQAKLEFPNLTTKYLDNLKRLGIVEIGTGSFGESYTDKQVYLPLIEHPLIKSFEQQIKQAGGTISIEEGIIRITSYGDMFIKAVLAKI